MHSTTSIWQEASRSHGKCGKWTGRTARDVVLAKVDNPRVAVDITTIVRDIVGIISEAAAESVGLGVKEDQVAQATNLSGNSSCEMKTWVIEWRNSIDAQAAEDWTARCRSHGPCEQV